MIRLARSPRMKNFMQTSKASSSLASQYVAGETPMDGVTRALALLEKDGIRSSLFYMGEYVDTPGLVEENVLNKTEVAEELAAAAIDIHISVDPTQIGHQINPSLVRKHAERISAKIKELIGNKDGLNCLMFDMEDASLNDPTIELHNKLQDRGLPVALTLQAYLRRTAKDMAQQIERGSRVRLVKGAFAAGPDIAFVSQKEIKENSRRLIDMMFSAKAKQSGFYPIVATHDTRLHDYAIARANENSWKKHEYEFEMLLGVRGDVARELAAKGQNVRLYVPFGKDWWPHAVRRIGENPRNAVLLARSFANL
tara:strand:+ start:445 stop:1377 length:933 start_codon:yes stop_codon:yes gene_type:complete